MENELEDYFGTKFFKSMHTSCLEKCSGKIMDFIILHKNNIFHEIFRVPLYKVDCVHPIGSIHKISQLYLLLACLFVLFFT